MGLLRLLLLLLLLLLFLLLLLLLLLRLLLLLLLLRLLLLLLLLLLLFLLLVPMHFISTSCTTRSVASFPIFLLTITDGPTNIRTYGRTDPVLEMRGYI